MDELVEEIKNKLILHWNYRGLKELPVEVKYYGNHLKELYLKENELTIMPNWISDLTNITNLYLSGNKLEIFPPEIRTMKQLKVLDLSDNKIDKLPSCIEELTSLKELILDDNYLNQLPIGLSEFHCLETLSMSRNNFIALPEWIGSLKNLERLFIDNNYVEELPNRLTLAPALTTISLCANRLKYLPLNSFVSPVTMKFNCNPNLNYLSYSILCQLLELGWEDGKNSFPINDLINNNTNENDKKKNLNLNLKLSVETLKLYKKKVSIELPRQLVKVYQIHQRTPVSLWELSLRVLYKNQQNDGRRNCHLEKWNIFYNLMINGPISVCINDECQEPIFTEAWITVGKSDECGLLIITTFCSERCANDFDAESYGIENFNWNYYTE